MVLPFLVSRMSKPETSPRTVQRPTSSVISFMGMTGSWMGRPKMASLETGFFAAGCASFAVSMASASASRARAAWISWIRRSSSPVTRMLAAQRMPNSSSISVSNSRSMPRLFR